MYKITKSANIGDKAIRCHNFYTAQFYLVLCRSGETTDDDFEIVTDDSIANYFVVKTDNESSES